MTQYLKSYLNTTSSITKVKLKMSRLTVFLLNSYYYFSFVSVNYNFVYKLPSLDLIKMKLNYKTTFFNLNHVNSCFLS